MKIGRKSSNFNKKEVLMILANAITARAILSNGRLKLGKI